MCGKAHPECLCLTAEDVKWTSPSVGGPKSLSFPKVDRGSRLLGVAEVVVGTTAFAATGKSQLM
jgi:hypothetical protein